MGEDRDSVWVDIRTSQRVVDLGLRAMLAGAEMPFDIRTEGPADAQPDLVLYDVINLNESSGDDLDLLLKHSVSTVIAVNRTLKPELGTRAREKGVEWAITLGISDDELVQVIRDAVEGNLDSEDNVAEEWDTKDYMGRDAGLSPRESSILQLVVMGRSDMEIASELYLSINSVKTYIRSTRHLPQIAGYGDTHYHVTKHVHDARTQTGVQILAGDGRVEELAQMLGALSQSTRESAREILTEAAGMKVG